jgi:hypothetical protein
LGHDAQVAHDRAALELELELLPLDSGDDDQGEPSPARSGRGKGWLLVVACLAGLLAVAALIGRAEVPEPGAALLPRPTSLVMHSATTVPPSYALAGADGKSLVVTGKGWTGTIPVDAALGDVTSVAGGRGMVVAVLSNGEARRWLDGDDESVSLGPAELVLANVRDDTLVWLVDSQHGRQEVRTVLAPPERGSRAIPVPRGWRIAGVNGQGLVLVGSDTGLGVAVWEPWEIDPPEVLDPAGRFLASSVRRVAWLRDGELVESGSPYREERMVLMHDDIVGAAYAPDGVTLALVGKPEGDVTRVRFLESDGSVDEGFVVEGSSIATFGWTAEGDFLANPGGRVEYRYDPSWGLTISDRRRLG